jgi:hypothetical protein
MNNSSRLELAARAEDVNDLLNHIAWTDTIRPELIKHKDTLSKMLVASVLGTPVQRQTARGEAIIVTTEQLAGRIEGIDFVLSLLEGILRRGVTALRDLSAQGYNIEKT